MIDAVRAELFSPMDIIERSLLVNGRELIRRIEAADPTELAYLVDRVAVNSDQPQVYGTQVGGCEGGKAVPRPIADEEGVHERRERIGLQPLEEYLASFEDGCAGEG